MRILITFVFAAKQQQNCSMLTVGEAESHDTTSASDCNYKHIHYIQAHSKKRDLVIYQKEKCNT